MDQIALLYTTWPDAETAERAAEAAVGERLAACVNILGEGRSIYRWNGQVERAAETIALFKTTTVLASRLKQLIVDFHPHETPAVICLDVQNQGSNSAFLGWVAEQTGEPS